MTLRSPRAGAALLSLAVALLASPASARAPVAAVTLDLGPAHLIIDDRWTVERGTPIAAGTATTTATTTATVSASATPIVLRGAKGAVLIATRNAAPNLVAWSRATRDAHVDELIAGFTAVDGATVLRRALATDGPSSVPVLELTLRRRGRVVAIRVILFRTLTVAAAATSDDRGPDATAALEHAVAGLHPDR